MYTGKGDGASGKIDHLMWSTAWLDQIPALCFSMTLCRQSFVIIEASQPPCKDTDLRNKGGCKSQ